MLKREMSVRKTIEQLQEEGFVTSFGIQDGKIFNTESRKTYEPSTFRIVKDYRFEGESNPSDESILIALEHDSSGEKGALLFPYGPMASEEDNGVLQALHF